MNTLKNANEQITLNFNLREPKGNKCTNIYAVIKIDGKQIKMPIGLKINSWQWDKKKQRPHLNNIMNVEEKENAMNVLTKINELNFAFSEWLLYICSGQMAADDNDLIDYLKTKIKIEDMANKNAIPPKRGMTASKMLKEAFTKRYGTKEMPNKVKVSSWENYAKHVEQFINYIKENAGVYDSVATLSKKGIYNYKEWLEDNARKAGKGDSKTIAQKCNTIIVLINEIAANPNYDHLHINPLQPYKIEKSLVKMEDKKRRALTDEEIEKIMKCKLNDEKLNVYRDVFKMQLESGVRFSDLHKLFEGDYKVSEENGQKVEIVMTKKEDITASVIVTKEIDELQNKYVDGLPIKLNEESYNKAIKKLFELAELINEETFVIDFLGTKKEEKGRLCDIVSNHWARHTFITNAVRSGWDINTLCYRTGHANDQQIRSTYAHITDEDKAKKVLKVNAQMQGNKIEDGAKNIDGEFAYNKGMEAKENELIKEAKEALLFLGANYEDIADINNLDELSVLLYTDYSTKFNTMGIDIMKLKGIFNTPNATLKEKKDILQKVIDETKAKNEWYLQMQWKKAMQEEKEYISFEDYKMYIKQRANKILSVE